MDRPRRIKDPCVRYNHCNGGKTAVEALLPLELVSCFSPRAGTLALDPPTAARRAQRTAGLIDFEYTLHVENLMIEDMTVI